MQPGRLEKHGGSDKEGTTIASKIRQTSGGHPSASAPAVSASHGELYPQGSARSLLRGITSARQ
jgi:hypothetical protein